MATNPSSVLALDVGARRVGVAVATVQARLARPLITLLQGEAFFNALETIIEVEGVQIVVVGFPRGMQGQHTAQTDAIEAFVEQLKQHVPLPIHMQD